MIKFLIVAIVLILGTFTVIKVSLPSLRLRSEQVSPTPTPRPPDTAVVQSPDGTMKLIMETQYHRDGSAQYTVFVMPSSENEKKLVFTETTNTGSLSLPRNTWSPDKKLFFIRKDMSEGFTPHQFLGAGFTFLVFKASGEPFKNSELYLDVAPQFAEKVPSYVMTDATGWASENLLIITTRTLRGDKKGPSFWFEVPSGAIIQLAH